MLVGFHFIFITKDDIVIYLQENENKTAFVKGVVIIKSSCLSLSFLLRVLFIIVVN